MTRRWGRDPFRTGLVQAVEDAARQALASSTTPGLAVALVHHGRLIWAAGYGAATAHPHDAHGRQIGDRLLDGGGDLDDVEGRGARREAGDGAGWRGFLWQIRPTTKGVVPAGQWRDAAQRLHDFAAAVFVGRDCRPA